MVGETDYLLTVVARDVAELASLATRGGQRLVTYLRLAEIKSPSRLPLAPSAPARRRPGAKPPPRNNPAVFSPLSPLAIPLLRAAHQTPETESPAQNTRPRSLVASYHELCAGSRGRAPCRERGLIAR